MESRLVQGHRMLPGRQAAGAAPGHRRLSHTGAALSTRRSVMRPVLLTFDVFGTLVDWRAGLRADLAAHDYQLTDKEFERVLAAQEVDETGPFRTYQAITAASLARALGLKADVADAIG